MTTIKLPGIDACVFDAYGTLFDVNGAARASQDLLGEKWQTVADLWRAKQLQYTWLRSLAGRRGQATPPGGREPGRRGDGALRCGRLR